jgi:aldose 1-epimerase
VNTIIIEAQSERAVLVPEAGCQCLSYSVGGLEVIAGPDDPNSWRQHPHRLGIPILFPWPGRVAGGRFTYRGKSYRLPINDPRGNSIHGFACERPFTVLRHGPYFVTSLLDSNDDSSIAAIWPWPFQLELDYEVGNGLRLKATVRNTASEAMPFGFGAHPYFRAPLGSGGSRSEMTLKLAAESRWPLDARMIPDGTPEPLAGKYDLVSPRAIDAETYDDAFHMMPYKRDEPRARLKDPSARVAVEIRADGAYGEFVVYVPPTDPIVAIEPYTSAPDAFNLAARGVESGMLELWPGETWSATFEIRISAP